MTVSLKKSWLWENYYYIVAAVYFLTFFIKGLPVGIICAGVMMVILLIFLLSKRKPGMPKKMRAVFCYALWSLFSIVSFAFSGLPYSVYIQAVSNALLPVIFAFFDGDHDKFERKLLNSYIICGAIGLFLMLTRPQWFVSYCLDRGYDYRRLSYAYGSIPMGNLGVVSIIIAFSVLAKSKGKRGKLKYLLAILFSFASMQRSAWIVSGCSLLFAHYYFFFRHRILKKRFLLVELLGIAVVLILLRDRILLVLNEWINAQQTANNVDVSIGLMFSSRSNQWIQGLSNSNLLIGSGFGSRGHKAVAAGLTHYVADGSWILMICETGIIGFAFFVMASIQALHNGLKHFRRLYVTAFICGIFMLQAIGSNVFELQLLAPVFWYAVGKNLRWSRCQVLVDRLRLMHIGES